MWRSEVRTPDEIVKQFAEDGNWRDLVSFTWNIRTQEGPAAIRAMLEARLTDVQPSHFEIEGDEHVVESEPEQEFDESKLEHLGE